MRYYIVLVTRGLVYYGMQHMLHGYLRTLRGLKKSSQDERRTVVQDLGMNCRVIVWFANHVDIKRRNAFTKVYFFFRGCISSRREEMTLKPHKAPASSTVLQRKYITRHTEYTKNAF